MKPERAVVGDALTPLTTTWQVVRDDFGSLVEALQRVGFDRKVYESMRELEPTDPLGIATRFMILNRGAYGGIWRVNSHGKFNVPYAKPKTPSPVDAANLAAVSQYLRSADVRVLRADFQEITQSVTADDAVFFDPPYTRTAVARPFVHYQETLFNWDEQIRLAKEARRLAELGAFVVVTNSPHDDILKLYADFKVIDATRHSALGSTDTRSTTMTERIFLSR